MLVDFDVRAKQGIYFFGWSIIMDYGSVIWSEVKV